MKRKRSFFKKVRAKLQQQEKFVQNTLPPGVHAERQVIHMPSTRTSFGGPSGPRAHSHWRATEDVKATRQRRLQHEAELLRTGAKGTLGLASAWIPGKEAREDRFRIDRRGNWHYVPAKPAVPGHVDWGQVIGVLGDELPNFWQALGNYYDDTATIWTTAPTATSGQSGGKKRKRKYKKKKRRIFQRAYQQLTQAPPLPPVPVVDDAAYQAARDYKQLVDLERNQQKKRQENINSTDLPSDVKGKIIEDIKNLVASNPDMAAVAAGLAGLYYIYGTEHGQKARKFVDDTFVSFGQTLFDWTTGVMDARTPSERVPPPQTPASTISTGPLLIGAPPERPVFGPEMGTVPPPVPERPLTWAEKAARDREELRSRYEYERRSMPTGWPSAQDRLIGPEARTPASSTLYPPPSISGLDDRGNQTRSGWFPPTDTEQQQQQQQIDSMAKLHDIEDQLAEFTAQQQRLEQLNPGRPIDLPEADQRTRDGLMEERKQLVGSGLSQKGLSTKDLDTIMKPYRPDGFLGTVPWDKISELPVWKDARSSFILNLDESGKPGYHWAGVFMDARHNGDKTIEYFDSLGDPPSPAIEQTLRQKASEVAPGELTLKVNGVAHQHPHKSTCGMHAANFIKKRYRSIPFAKVTGYEQAQKSEADLKKVKVFQKYFHKV